VRRVTDRAGEAAEGTRAPGNPAHRRPGIEQVRAVSCRQRACAVLGAEPNRLEPSSRNQTVLGTPRVSALFSHERSELSHGRKRLADKPELLLAESLRVANGSALQTAPMRSVVTRSVVGNNLSAKRTVERAPQCLGDRAKFRYNFNRKLLVCPAVVDVRE